MPLSIHTAVATAAPSVVPAATSAAASATSAATALPISNGATIPVTQATLSPALQAYASEAPKSALALHAPWLTHLFAGVFILSAVLLVFLLAVQTTKQEGLSGTVGGRVESSYRPRMGFEQQLVRLTMVVAITFVISATIVSLSGI